MARSASSRPLRIIGVLFGLTAALFGLIGAGVMWSNAQWTPKLALDLAGGTQIILAPRPLAGQQQPTQEQIDEAVRIIQRRVNGSGISEAEVTKQGSNNIVVSLPGTRDPATIALVQQSAQLQFRALIAAEPTGAPPPGASPSPSATGSPSPTGSGAASPSPSRTGTPSASESARSGGGSSASPSGNAAGSSNNAPINRAFVADPQRAVTTPSPTTTGSPSPGGQGGTATPSPNASATPQATPTNASDPAWVTPALERQFQQLDCTQESVRQELRGAAGDPAKPLVTCADDGTEKYILGPAEVVGTDVTGAVAGLERNSQGFAGTSWEVNLTFSGEGSRKFADVTRRLAALQGTQNRFGIVLDNVVISAPTTNEPILGGQARISGNFTQESAQTLANQLRYGALPVTFVTLTQQDISATLGGEQLQRGLLAGLLGMLLVVVYSLLQYRVLGVVTVASLVIAGVITYGLVVLLGWRQGYRLSLPGIAGLIVSIGITADSFIVYFERIRDEVRDGRSLPAAVEVAWARARRTILISDAVNFLAAVVLYVLAVGGVRGFAFTLGLTTIVDVIVVFLFTKPLVTLLARTRFFGGGHRLSGFDAKHLGRQVAYAGRGRLRVDRPGDRRAGSTAVGAEGEAAELEPGPDTTGEVEEAAPAARPARRAVRVGAGAPGPAGGGDGLTIAERRAARERAARTGEAAVAGDEGAEPADAGDATTGTGPDGDRGRAQRSGATGRDL